MVGVAAATRGVLSPDASSRLTAEDLTVVAPDGAAATAATREDTTPATTSLERDVWLSRALDLLQRHGAVIVTEVMPMVVAKALAAHLKTAASAASATAGSPHHDTTNTTLSPRNRRHIAISMRSPAVSAALEALASSLHALLYRALDSKYSRALNEGPEGRDRPSLPSESESDGGRLLLLESGLLVSSPGAVAQPLHTDTAHRPSESRVLKVQLAAEPISADMGPIEIVSGSSGAPPATLATASAPLPLPLPRGAALVYDTRVWHRGGSNKSRKRRPVYYVAVMRDDGAANPPAGLPYTIPPSEVACYELTPAGAAPSPPMAAGGGDNECSLDVAVRGPSEPNV
jgi:hypothetical protein